jgi:copper(I)-binding protein
VGAPAPGQKVAGAYMELASRASGVLAAVASPVAERAELHLTELDGGVMRMRPVGGLALVAGQIVKLAPGGLHIMLIDLKRPLKPGEKIPITFTVQRTDSSRAVFSVQAEVRAAAPAAGHHGAH